MSQIRVFSRQSYIHKGLIWAFCLVLLNACQPEGSGSPKAEAPRPAPESTPSPAQEQDPGKAEEDLKTEKAFEISEDQKKKFTDLIQSNLSLMKKNNFSRHEHQSIFFALKRFAQKLEQVKDTGDLKTSPSTIYGFAQLDLIEKIYTRNKTQIDVLNIERLVVAFDRLIKILPTSEKMNDYLQLVKISFSQQDCITEQGLFSRLNLPYTEIITPRTICFDPEYLASVEAKMDVSVAVPMILKQIAESYGTNSSDAAQIQSLVSIYLAESTAIYFSQSLTAVLTDVSELIGGLTEIYIRAGASEEYAKKMEWLKYTLKSFSENLSVIHKFFPEFAFDKVALRKLVRETFVEDVFHKGEGDDPFIHVYGKDYDPSKVTADLTAAKTNESLCKWLDWSQKLVLISTSADTAESLASKKIVVRTRLPDLNEISQPAKDPILLKGICDGPIKDFTLEYSPLYNNEHGFKFGEDDYDLF